MDQNFDNRNQGWVIWVVIIIIFFWCIWADKNTECFGNSRRARRSWKYYLKNK